MKTNDSSYDGSFFICVKTTKIFCVPSCKAKLPLKSNIEFVPTYSDAIKKGYRPCKRCHPSNGPFFNPEWVNVVKSYLMANLNRRIPDTELVDLVNLDISTIRRYFQKQYGMSIKEYHRTLRLNEARKLISTGLKLTEVASSVGYQSVKGFKLAYNNQFGDMKNESS